MHPANPDEVAIAVFAKAPLPGYAKTRLIPALGEDGAAALQSRFIERTLRTAVKCGVGPVTLWCAPDSHDLFFHACAARYGIALREQGGDDLGERMLQAFRTHAPQPAIVIGTDCPALTEFHLQDCGARLRNGDDAVILPAEDGGYVLIGLRCPVPALFIGISWGSEQVMRQTRERLHDSALRWSEPHVLWDVDSVADLARLGWRHLDDASFRSDEIGASQGQQDCPDDER